MIPDNITKKHIEEALAEIDKEGIRPGRHSSTYDLVHEGKYYPPKLVISIANRYANGEELDPSTFSGGENTPAFNRLDDLGYEIVTKSGVHNKGNKSDMDNDSVQVELIERYKTLIREDQNKKELYKWRLIKDFQEKWDIEADNFAEMAQSIEFGNLLDYRSKTLIHFVEDYPEEARSLFKMLFDETISLKKRIGDFGQQAEKLVREYYPDKGSFQDERTIATYLTFRYPDKYTFYKYSFYSDYTDFLKIDRPSAGERYIHYLELVEDFIEEAISEDEELIELSRSTLTDDCYVDENLNILAQDILFRILEGDKESESDFKKVLGQMGYEQASNYFSALRKVVKELEIDPSDDRVVFSVRTDDPRLNLTIGQRYCLSFYADNEDSWRFIHPEDKVFSVTGHQFKGTPEAYFHWAKTYSDVQEEFDKIIEASQKELNRSQSSGFKKYNNDFFEQSVFDGQYRTEIFNEVFDMESDFTWVDTHKKITEKLLNYRDRQDELVEILQEAGVTSIKDEDESGEIELSVIDPFSFFRFINKYGDENRLMFLRNIAERLGVKPLPTDTTGLPTVTGPIARLFPYTKNRTNEVDILWDVFEEMMDGEINSETWKKALSIWNVGKKNFTQALFTVSPEDYLPIDQHTRPYLKKVLNIDPSYETAEEYRNIMNQIRKASDRPFYQISIDAYNWHTSTPPKTNGGNNGNNSEKVDTLNTILYGPPGTGKTYTLRDTYAPYFTQEQKLKTKKEYEVEVLEEFSWWEVIALVLLEGRELTVPEIKEHRFIRIKENLSNSRSVNATIWGQLQTHTSPDEKNVGVSNRQEPYLFRKQKNSVWSIISENCEQKAPYLLKALEEIEQYESKVETKQNYRFTTFHQSFTYEDFVEGIKPKLNSQAKESDSDEIEYTIEKGIFYQAADEACRLAGFMGLQDCLSHSEEERKNQFKDAKPYALFIDEINRGNISAILGELITLIEKDKRLTEEHELIVQLPYSKNSFGVPPNLYILGTLNTADRSVEALDTALRRRFSFIEVDPNPNLLEGIEVAGVDIKKLLQTINLRIVKLLDRDHKIGHSYFLPLKEKPQMKLLRDIFQDRVIPLLKEYFFGDFGKIGLVLGSSFVEEVHSKNTGVFAEFSGYEEVAAEYDERKVYTIAPRREWDFEQIYSPKDTTE